MTAVTVPTAWAPSRNAFQSIRLYIVLRKSATAIVNAAHTVSVLLHPGGPAAAAAVTAFSHQPGSTVVLPHTWIIICIPHFYLYCFYLEWVPVFHALHMTLQEVVCEQLHCWVVSVAAVLT